MSTTRRSTARVNPLLVAAFASLAALVTVCVFLANVIGNVSADRVALNERIMSGEVVSAGHVLVNATSAPDGSAAPVTTTSATTTSAEPITTTTGETSTRRTAPVGKVAPVCAEDDACWNSCTMGNRGPCDLGATLPYGARFAVHVWPSLDTTCDQAAGHRWTAVHLTVSAVSATGDTLAGVTRLTCVRGDALLTGGMSAGMDMETMFREVAAQL